MLGYKVILSDSGGGKGAWSPEQYPNASRPSAASPFSTSSFSKAFAVGTAKQALPLMGASMLMFFMAALIEGFVSPSGLPYLVKATVAVLSSAMLMFYFVVLGYPQEGNVLVEVPRTADDIFRETD